MAADHDVVPRNLLIQEAMTARPLFHTYGLLSALKKTNGLEHLYLLYRDVDDECIELSPPLPASIFNRVCQRIGKLSSFRFTPSSLSAEIAYISRIQYLE